MDPKTPRESKQRAPTIRWPRIHTNLVPRIQSSLLRLTLFERPLLTICRHNLGSAIDGGSCYNPEKLRTSCKPRTSEASGVLSPRWAGTAVWAPASRASCSNWPPCRLRWVQPFRWLLLVHTDRKRAFCRLSFGKRLPVKPIQLLGFASRS